MLGTRKSYDPELAKTATQAEQRVFDWLRSSRYFVQEFPEGPCGPDALAWNEDDDTFPVEVQWRECWKPGGFPYDDLHIMERMERCSADTLFFSVRSDLRLGYLCQRSSLLPERKFHHPNKYGNDEYVFKVPLIETSLLDFDRPFERPVPLRSLLG